MASIFEKYLLNVIRSHQSIFPADISILDGNKEGRKRFYNSPSLAFGDAKPDIILKQGGEFKIIADVKYKNSTKEVDRYQIISHALCYGAHKAVLILPLENNEPRSYLKKLGSVGDEYQVDVYEYFYKLNNENLDEEETKLANIFLSLI